MTLHVAPLEETTPDAEGGLGALVTDRGNLPLDEITAKVAITGLLGTIELAQGFRNPFDVPLEATYIFPLPDRAAVTAMRMTADGRVVDAELKERGQARAEYDQAIAEGKRASIAEEERPDVFTMRVGNILPGERVMVALTLVGPLSYEDGEAMFRLPLVVAPRYIPGEPPCGRSDQAATCVCSQGDGPETAGPPLPPGGGAGAAGLRERPVLAAPARSEGPRLRLHGGHAAELGLAADGVVGEAPGCGGRFGPFAYAVGGGAGDLHAAPRRRGAAPRRAAVRGMAVRLRHR